LLLRALNGGGAAFLLWLSWKIATSAGGIESQPEKNAVGYLGAAVVSTPALAQCWYTVLAAMRHSALRLREWTC
jgi:threonine/homoserine/homoserine lactone efflux protein